MSSYFPLKFIRMYGCTSYAPPFEYAPDRLPGLGYTSTHRSANARFSTFRYSGPSGAIAMRMCCCDCSGVYSRLTELTSGA